MCNIHDLQISRFEILAAGSGQDPKCEAGPGQKGEAEAGEK